jgi:hypothetical protein
MDRHYKYGMTHYKSNTTPSKWVRGGKEGNHTEHKNKKVTVRRPFRAGTFNLLRGAENL